MSAAAVGLVLAVFFACAVEAVEALTIVIAVGSTRSWRSALSGVGCALIVLAALIVGLGPALTSLPIDILRVFVGGFLLVIGLQWLRKAILRASGRKSIHDEDAIFLRERAAALTATGSKNKFDSYSFVVAGKGTLLEGLEVAFIVLTFGANSHHIPLAAAAAGLAIMIVVGAGFAVRKPLARVPENTLKFGVGIMLCAFGMFWSAEGAGATWPGADAALLIIIPVLLVLALTAVKHIRLLAPPSTETPGTADTRVRGGVATGLINVWLFVVGDDWVVAVGAAAVIAACAVVATSAASAWWVLPLGVILLLVDSLRRATR